MREYRKKQRILKKTLNIICIFTAVFMFVYIGVVPFIKELWGMNAITICSRVCELLVLISVVILTVYNIKYSKCNSLLEWIEYELDDAGYYYLNRNENNADEFITNSQRLLIENKFTTQNDIDAHDFNIDMGAVNGKNLMYFVNVDNLDRNDIIAYIDSITYDATVQNLKRKADIVITFVTNKADNDAIGLSKMITTMGRKEQVKIALVIAELDTRKCYFLGNRQTNLLKLIAKYVMMAELPFSERLIGKERLASQDELEENMKSFNAKDFVDGKFYIR